MTEHEPAAFCLGLRSRLVGSLTLFTGDRELGEELAHEALARAIERWDRVRVMAAPEAWVYRTAFNLAASTFRRRAIERRALARVAAAGPHRALPDADEAIAVRAAIGSLPARQRAVIVARFYGGLSVEETAVALDCAPGTVKAHTHQAIARLRAGGLLRFEDEEEEMDDASAR